MVWGEEGGGSGPKNQGLRVGGWGGEGEVGGSGGGVYKKI